ncbi:hypothetical protein FHG87_025531 [Trinorchestia longiramus]|nr:hypothetical protein FHG87_025531 [Trinorchestia longiramus]
MPRQLPILNVVVCGLLTALTALLFDLEKLVEFMSIGILMAYTIVSASVIILRYQPEHKSGQSSDFRFSSLTILRRKFCYVVFNVSQSGPYRPPGGVEEMQGGGRRIRLEWEAYITV